MELSEIGNLLAGFVGGSGFGSIAMAFFAYKTGLKNKEKSKFDLLDERLTEIERRLGL